MKTLFKPSIWKILKIFYDNRNSHVHLREISRKAGLNESTISSHLNFLLKVGILKTEKDANLKKFYINNSKIKEIFTLFDAEKLSSLPQLRKDAIELYISHLEKKPLILIVFGSTAKGTYSKNSDIDLLEVSPYNKKEDKTAKYVEAQTGIKIQIFLISPDHFKNEIKLKKDKVILSALETGFPVFNAKYFYEAIYNE